MIEHKKYKDFKKIAQIIKSLIIFYFTLKRKIFFIKSCINFEDTCFHKKLTASRDCLQVLHYFETNDSPQTVKISRHSIKDIEPEMLEIIFKLLDYKHQKILLIKWAFHIIRHPHIEPTDENLLKITSDKDFDKSNAFKVLHNLVYFMDEGSQEERQNFLRYIQFKHSIVKNPIQIVGHFKPPYISPLLFTPKLEDLKQTSPFSSIVKQSNQSSEV